MTGSSSLGMSKPHFPSRCCAPVGMKRLLFSNYSPRKHRPSLCHLGRSEAKWRDLRFNVPFLEMFF
jgi:hypothetical protein